MLYIRPNVCNLINGIGDHRNHAETVKRVAVARSVAMP